MNRFSKDINRIDNDFSQDMTWIIDCLFWVLAAVFIGTLVSLWILIFVPVIVVFCCLLIRYYIRTYRDVSRLEAISNSPILTTVSESINGASTIRSFKMQKQFTDINYMNLNNQIRAYFWMESIDVWFAVRLLFISAFMMIASISFCISYRETNPLVVGILLLYLSWF